MKYAMATLATAAMLALASFGQTIVDTYSFKMDKKWRPLLFPESETYIINKVA